MMVEENGDLGLGLCDLDHAITHDRDFRVEHAIGAIQLNGLRAFNRDVRIAASYAFAAGYQVNYAAAPGVLYALPRSVAITGFLNIKE